MLFFKFISIQFYQTKQLSQKVIPSIYYYLLSYNVIQTTYYYLPSNNLIQIDSLSPLYFYII